MHVRRRPRRNGRIRRAIGDTRRRGNLCRIRTRYARQRAPGEEMILTLALSASVYAACFMFNTIGGCAASFHLIAFLPASPSPSLLFRFFRLLVPQHCGVIVVIRNHIRVGHRRNILSGRATAPPESRRIRWAAKEIPEFLGEFANASDFSGRGGEAVCVQGADANVSEEPPPHLDPGVRLTALQDAARQILAHTPGYSLEL